MSQDIYFDNYATLELAAVGATMKILTDYVAPVAEEILKKHIKSDIYDIRPPKEGGWVHGTTYQRRGTLADDVYSRLDGVDTLFVSSSTRANRSVVPGYHFVDGEEGALLRLIETGPWGIWRTGFSRPAVSNTQKEYDTSSDIQNAIKKGINDLIGECK